MYKQLIFILSLAIAFQSCRLGQKQIDVKIDRMEQYLFSLPLDSIETAIPALKQKYGELLDLYSQRVIAIGKVDQPQYAQDLKKFITDSYMYDSYKKVSSIYPDVSNIEKELSKAFSKYHEAFSDRAIPSVYTIISGFNNSMVTSDSILAISLDMYLGKNEEMYSRLGLAGYQKNLMEKEFIVPDCMKAWGYTEFLYNDSINNVLTNILYEGKIAYFQQKMLPSTPDSLIFGFTKDQLQWCESNEKQMWVFLVEKKMLYMTDDLTITKLVGPAPFCTYFTRESPGKAVVWLGYRIIESYMKHNKSSLEELLTNDDYQDILSKSRYKP